ncbi:MAG: L,D-transpeptidase family protein [Muribaculaceae bacterium]|nr:L,D-transpeptidase family protein [Muribaculaceae bacterium]
MKLSNILFSLLLLILGACGSGKGRQDDSVSESFDTDSIIIDENSAIKVDSISSDSVAAPYISFKSKQELLEFLRNSDDCVAYRAGIIPLIADKSLDYAEKLVNNSHDGFIIVDKGRMKVIFYDKYGRELLNYGMACAKNFGTKHKKADSRTPEGFFSVGGVYNSTEWLFTDDDGNTSDKKGQFGPRFIRIKCPTTSQIGIHGTCSPWTIGHRSSHGCIRVTNENILELVKHVSIGMPVIVVPGKRDMEINKAEESETTWIPSSFSATEPKLRELDEETVNRNAGIKPEESGKEQPDSLNITKPSEQGGKDNTEGENEKGTNVPLSNPETIVSNPDSILSVSPHNQKEDLPPQKH